MGKEENTRTWVQSRWLSKLKKKCPENFTLQEQKMWYRIERLTFTPLNCCKGVRWWLHEDGGSRDLWPLLTRHRLFSLGQITPARLSLPIEKHMDKRARERVWMGLQRPRAQVQLRSTDGQHAVDSTRTPQSRHFVRSPWKKVNRRQYR